MDVNMAIAEIIPAAMHSLLFTSAKLSPQSMTDMVKPLITMTMAKAPNSTNTFVISADIMPSIDSTSAMTEAVIHMIGKTSFMKALYHL